MAKGINKVDFCNWLCPVQIMHEHHPKCKNILMYLSVYLIDTDLYVIVDC